MKEQNKTPNEGSEGNGGALGKGVYSAQVITWKPHREMNNTKGELITIKDHEVIEGKVGCCFNSWWAGICPNKMAGYKVFWLLQ